jgi:hypothetical protein
VSSPLDSATLGREVQPGLSAYRLTRADLAAANARLRAPYVDTPSLDLKVWRGPLHVHLRLVLTERPDGGRMRQTVLREADWDPQELTPRLMVEWAYRATASWLTENDALLAAQARAGVGGRLD